MDVTEVRVEYGRTVSDQAYGSERVGVTLTATTGAEPAARVVEALGRLARELVAEQLRQAASPAVRRAASERWTGDPDEAP